MNMPANTPLPMPRTLSQATPRIPNFRLEEHHGNTITAESLRGDTALIYFGFTNCRTVCPRALARLSSTLDLLAESGRNLQALFITVDPERDTAAALKRYLEHRAPRFLGITGASEELAALRSSMRVYAGVRRGAGEEYAMPHSAFAYLVGPDGTLVEHFGDALTTKELTIAMRAALDSIARAN